MSAKRIFASAIAISFIVVWLASIYLRTHLPAQITAGYFHFPPFIYALPGQPPRGFLIDVFEEVSRRRGFALTWVNTTGNIEPALASGKVDLYPQLLITPARSEKFAMSEPWWETTLVIVSSAKQPVLTTRDLNGRKINVFAGSHTSTLIEQQFPGSIQIFTRSSDAILDPLCDGTAYAAVAESTAMQLLIARAKRPCPGLDLHIQPFPELTLSYGVGTRKADAAIGADLQNTLLDLSLDGTVSRIGVRWNVYSTNQIGLIRDLIRFRNQRFWLIAFVLFLIASLLGIARLYYKMREARRMAVDASRMQSRFLANMSHEIRTPLNGILGMTSLLATTDLSPPQRDYVEAVSTSGDVLLALINDCLDLAKIESGNLVLESIALSLEDITERVLQVLGPKAIEKGLSISCYIDPQIPTSIYGDPNRLQQILFNLIGNAIKFTDRGYVWIEAYSLAPGLIRCIVEDSGPGISAEAQSRLFERFSQADSSTTRKFGGTGLGLAIVRELVLKMGGQIGYEANPAGGSRFWFALPLRSASSPQIPVFSKRVATEFDDLTTHRLLARLLPQWGCQLVQAGEHPDLVLEAPDWSRPIKQSRLRQALSGQLLPSAKSKPATRADLGLSVLVAEDNLVNQRLIASFLNKLGCHYDLVENGEKAVTSALSKKYDVILMDYQMPVLDGFSAMQQIRASGSPHAVTPIIAVTAGVLSINRAEFLAAGFNNILIKPYSLDSLHFLLQSLNS